MTEIRKSNRFRIMTAAGLILLAVGGLAYGYTPGAAPELEARCREVASTRGPALAAMADKCREEAFASSLTATDASTAARSIGAANQLEIVVHMAAMFALGLGGVLAFMGLFGMFGQRRLSAPTSRR